jgi:hypothetical protein
MSIWPDAYRRYQEPIEKAGLIACQSEVETCITVARIGRAKLGFADVRSCIGERLAIDTPTVVHLSLRTVR